MSESNEDLSDLTPEEKRVLRRVARERGEEYARENAELILAQARRIGDL